MGDTSPSANPGSDYESSEVPTNIHQGRVSDDGSLTNPQSPSPPDPAAFQGQYQQIFTSPPPNHFSNQLDNTLAPVPGRQGPYDMSAMTNALPQSGYRPGYGSGQHQRYSPAGPNMMPQQQHMPQLANQHFYIPQHQPMPSFYNIQMSTNAQLQQQHQFGFSSPRTGMNVGYYPTSMIMNQPPASVTGYYCPPNQFPAHNPLLHNDFSQPYPYPPDGSSGDPRSSSVLQKNNNRGNLAGLGSNEADSAGSRPSIVRGPPRKPRQSGHAIWIGNLPPQTKLMSLVHHVCREATGLESLFLISKSNCAFANFKDETSCTTAQQKLHDSNFQSVRLVSRLRKSTVEGTSGQTAPTGPAAISPNVQSLASDAAPVNASNKTTDPSSTQDSGLQVNNTPAANGTQQKDKYFILKSLTVEDLELSTQNGVWATQSHNESALNEAFAKVDNVYLVFSANKSGEYFGYARMVSPINHDPAAAIKFAPKAQAANNIDLPKAIPTEATDTCPRGRIIDDSARGTIFWEVDDDEAEEVSDTVSEHSDSARSTHDGEGASKGWGKPFKLEWISTTRLPFYRTRGLRNPWNSNREVKIARDGTELEPVVGKKLLGLFNRIQSPVSVPTMGYGTAYMP
ncbi:hypothetical protein GGS21DRAFT_77888 [Xylaria nigripes]|nr:hypothetical protein GGS21DRAFT_77888 [Xylaria nigripes]